MTIGQVIHGFRLVSVTNLDAVGANVHLFRHEKTGAQLLWTNRADENKTFAVWFRTVPEDDTGVFHILEHSVLCGSDRYPVREPFVELLKSSLNTFLNAMTFPDKTVYPVSSRNDQDFRNLMGVYLDAVFCPAIYKNKNIFLQEGWHYELDEETGDPKYVGVVYGEMKGAMSSVDEIIDQNILRLLFPDNCYGFNSGGDPEKIPELTYEQFLENHRRFYHPSNASFFLDGSVKLETALSDIESYLAPYSYREPDFSITPQEPLPYREETLRYAAAPGSDGDAQAYYAMGRILGTWQDAELCMAAQVLQDYLTGSNHAPLTRAVLEQGLGQDVRLDVQSERLQSIVELQIRNTSEDKLPGMRSALRAILASILEKGLDREELTASLNRLEFQSRERREPFGLYLALYASGSWLYGGDPTLYMDPGKVFDALRAKLNGPFFEEVLRKMLLGDEGTVVLKLLPSRTKEAEDLKREEDRLRAAAAGWTQADREALLRQQEALALWQKTPDSPEALETIPHLALSDLSPEPLWTAAEESTLLGVRIIRPQVSVSGTVYLNLYFALPGIRPEDLSTLSLMTELLGELPAGGNSVSQLQRRIKTNLGALDFSASILGLEEDRNRCVPMLRVSVSVLESQVGEAEALLRMVLLETDFGCKDSIREILQQTVALRQQRLSAAGHMYAISRSLSGVTAEDTALEALNGFSCYDRLRAAATDFEEAYPALRDTLERICGCFTRANLTLGIAGNMSDTEVSRLCGLFPAGSSADPMLCLPQKEPEHTAIVVASGVAYAAQSSNLSSLGLPFHGSMLLMAKFLSLNYLWVAIRVQGGAYGAGLSLRPNGSIFSYSYRDPNPARTLEIYKGMADFLRSGESIPLEQTIIGAVADSEPLLDAKAESQLAITRALRGITLEKKRRERRELLGATREDLLRCCELLETMAKTGGVCVVGSEALVDACGEAVTTRLMG